MRVLVSPPPAVRCDVCGGELLLKKIAPDGTDFDYEIETLACAHCGIERTYRALHDPYSPNTAAKSRRL